MGIFTGLFKSRDKPKNSYDSPSYTYLFGQTVLSAHKQDISGIIEEWIKNECSDSVEQIATVIRNCFNSYNK